MAVINASPNMRAFLDMIAFSEGTLGVGNDGYNVIVGGGLFDDYSVHPRQRIWIPRINNYSTAAGRYQLLERYFDVYKTQLNLPDFSPLSQDKIAMQQIKEQKALPEVEAGNIEYAIQLCRNIWASLPGSGYGQHENKMDDLVAFYQRNGGVLA